ncbi:MAG TPA: V-type ATP synthase subunit K [Candidatus Syntrophosphaera sp.]|jgi:V/A-type H+-transporting ATPase subunit K|nr:MAG: V-type sodium ATPase subunit K [Candidatus Cloacimonetes bacterium ADurb.Bin211]HRR98379.1 V-type ATP synthase subunit K [Candidatus Syntrophosphaera sp.]
MPYILLQAGTAAANALPISGHTTAYILAWLGLFLMVALSGIGSAVGTVIGGSATIAAMKKREDVFANCMILSALPGTQGLYGFGAFFILKGFATADVNMITAAAIFGAGLMSGLVNLLSAYFQSRVVSTGIESIGNGHNVFSNTLILAVYPELYAIISFAACFLISAMLPL